MVVTGLCGIRGLYGAISCFLAFYRGKWGLYRVIWDFSRLSGVYWGCIG